MKTHGICNAKSARKHRKMGHATLRLPNGRHVWTSIASSIEVPTENGLLVGYNRKRARREGKRVDKPFDKSMVANDEKFTSTTDFGEAFQRSAERAQDFANAMTANVTFEFNKEDHKKLLNENERILRKKWPLMSHDIEIGASYMPRKCNAASKPYEVLRGSYAEEFVVVRRQGDGGKEQRMSFSDFLALVSRRVWL